MFNFWKKQLHFTCRYVPFRLQKLAPVKKSDLQKKKKKDPLAILCENSIYHYCFRLHLEHYFLRRCACEFICCKNKNWVFVTASGSNVCEMTEKRQRRLLIWSIPFPSEISLSVNVFEEDFIIGIFSQMYSAFLKCYFSSLHRPLSADTRMAAAECRHFSASILRL